MPASGWAAISTIGFKYKDASLANGPVKVAQIKKTPSGTFLVKVLLKNGGPTSIAVTPGRPDDQLWQRISHSARATSTAAVPRAVMPKPNNAMTFKVSNDGAPAGCVAACVPGASTTTSSTTSTTISIPCCDGDSFLSFQNTNSGRRLWRHHRRDGAS